MDGKHKFVFQIPNYAPIESYPPCSQWSVVVFMKKTAVICAKRKGWGGGLGVGGREVCIVRKSIK